MYLKYHILKIEKKQTSTGKWKADVDLQDFNGVIESKVTIWEGFPNFATLKVGDEVIGAITVKVNGQYTNKTLNTEKTTGYGNPGRQPSISMNKIMEKKQEAIQQSQGIKDLGIRLSSSMNKAIDLAMAQAGEGMSPDVYKTLIIQWRTWILENWDVDLSRKQPPF